MPNDQPPLGIDLGTTYCVVAYLDSSGRPTSIVNSAGDLLTPSAVVFEDGEVIVGKEAVKSGPVVPDGFADCFKRDMGRSSFRRRILSREIPPEVLNGFLLARLRQDAERRIGPVRQAVITVPAFFDETRRKATQDAGRLAGIDVLDIINEPTAAAIAFGWYHAMACAESPARHRVLVYDLGGGTFDVTILEINGSEFRTLATDGDVQLGGKDFDERLVNYLAEHFMVEHGVDPRSDPSDAIQLWCDAQDIKHALTERQKTSAVVFHAGVRVRREVSRAEFEDLTRDLLERTESTTALVVKQAGLAWSDIDKVLLVGGSTRMPMVAEMLRRVTGKEPDRSQSPDEVVAHGAALYAGMLMDKDPTPQANRVRLVNVNSHSLGVVGIRVETGERVNAILIPKNTPLPCRKVKRFRTARDGQADVQVTVVEGESPRPEHCITLGQCVVRDLPPGLPKGSGIEVEYTYAANGRISVRARVPSVRQSASVEIHRNQSRDLEDLETWRKRLCGPVPAVAAQAGSDSTDRAALIKALDDLYAEAGERAAGMDLPPELEKGKRALHAAVQQTGAAQAAVEQAEAARQTAFGPQETARSSAEAAQARQALQRARTNARFAQIVLGRDCLRAGIVPAEFEPRMVQVRQIQERLRPR